MAISQLGVGLFTESECMIRSSSAKTREAKEKIKMKIVKELFFMSGLSKPQRITHVQDRMQIKFQWTLNISDSTFSFFYFIW